MDHNLSEAIGVHEAYDFGEANDLLKEGWTIHSMWPDQYKIRYVLIKF